MCTDRHEELADEALRRPVRQPDLAAALADADQLGGSALLVGREHDPEGGDHHVETLAGERQAFGVGLAEREGEPFGLGPFSGAVEQRRHVVGRGHVAPAPRGGGTGLGLPLKRDSHSSTLSTALAKYGPLLVSGLAQLGNVSRALLARQHLRLNGAL